MTQYGVLAGLNLPVRGQAVWKLSSIEYNVPIEGALSCSASPCGPT
jgi:hypothetical protein